MTNILAGRAWAVIGVMAVIGVIARSAEPTAMPRTLPIVSGAQQCPDSTSKANSAVCDLRIADVHLEAPPDPETGPAAVLRFDLFNAGHLRVTDITLQIRIIALQEPAETGARRVLAGPFAVRGFATIEPGYTFQYELLLRNVPSDCRCAAEVSVLSARAVPRAQRPPATRQMV